MDWRVAKYTKSLKLQCCYHPRLIDYDDDNDGKEDIAADAERYETEKVQDEDYVEGSMEFIQGYIEEKLLGLGVPKSIGPRHLSLCLPHAGRFDVEGVCSDVNEGDRTAMIALLLVFIPNLEVLYLAESTWDVVFESLEYAIHWMSDRNLQGSRRARKFLPKLSRIGFLGSPNSPKGDDFEAFMPFAALPSVRKLSGRFVEGTGSAECSWHLPDHTSNVTEITLLRSTVKAKYLTELLVGIRALKRFTYDHREQLNDDQQGMEAHMMVGTLLEHAKHSLEYLCLTNRDKISASHEVRDLEHDSHSCNGSLRGFEVLKEVVLDSSVYADQLHQHNINQDVRRSAHHSHARPLIDILPASIETLKLVGFWVENHTQCLLVGLFQQKESRLPRLRKLVIEIRKNGPGIPRERKLRECCADVGVALAICPV